VLPSTHKHELKQNHKLYSEIVSRKNDKKFTLTLKTTDNHTPAEIIRTLKEKVKPSELKVGISSLRTMRDGRVLIEASSKTDINILGDKIREKCSETMTVNMQTLRKPRMIIINTPLETTTENILESLTQQNPELDPVGDNIVPQYCYTTKREIKNIVIEVDSETRKRLLNNKVKLGWTLCKVDDYLVAKRCYRCSKYGHIHKDCKGEEVCPLCTGSHKLKECNKATSEHKCVNCITYNKHHPHTQIETAHSSLDKKCPSLIAVLDKYKKNIDY
jgi:hypothetical protein